MMHGTMSLIFTFIFVYSVKVNAAILPSICRFYLVLQNPDLVICPFDFSIFRSRITVAKQPEWLENADLRTAQLLWHVCPCTNLGNRAAVYASLHSIAVASVLRKTSYMEENISNFFDSRNLNDRMSNFIFPYLLMNTCWAR